MNPHNASILVIDDMPANLQMLNDMLSNAGYIVRSATSGKQGLDSAQAEYPDLILLDICMPGIDGYEVCRQLKSDPDTQNIPVIFISGLIDHEDKIKGFQVGGVDYITKPFQRAEVLARIEVHLKILRSHRLLEQKNKELFEAKAEVERLNRNLEGNLDEKESFLRVVTDNFPNSFISLIESDFTISFSAGSEFKKMNLNPDHFNGLHVNDVFGENASLVKDYYERTFQGYECQFELYIFDQYQFYRTVPLYSADNTIHRIMVVVENITERKIAESEKERFLSIIEQVSEGIVITDVTGKIQFINSAFEAMSGYSKSELLGENPRIFKSGHHETDFYEKIWNSITSGISWNGKVVNKRKDGQLYTEEMTISPAFNANKEIISFVAVKRDITREINLEEQLRQAQKMEAIGQLTGGVAHDFNNLLQVINGYTDLVLDDLAKTDSHYESLTQVGKAGKRATNLVRQLLIFSRREVMQPKILNLNTVISDLLKMLGRVIGEHIHLEWNPGENLKTIFADRGMVEQSIMNLCVNARDAMEKGGNLTIRTSEQTLDEVFCENKVWADPGLYTVLEVSDTGCGMEAAVLKRIFEPFFTTKEMGRGTGLGLATVYGVVKQHEGLINVESQINNGTVFYLYWPVEEIDQKELLLFDEEPVRGGNETILLAEDDKMVRSITKRILENAGYSVFAVENGKEALEMYDQQGENIDLGLLDVVMPEIGGKDVYEYIVNKGSSMKVLFASGYSRNSIHNHFINENHLDFVQKPYKRVDLLTVVRQVLDDK